jgi:hypothetical protein
MCTGVFAGSARDAITRRQRHRADLQSGLFAGEGAVDSVISQVRPGDEVLVTDNGSTDGTAQIIRPYGDRTRYFRFPACWGRSYPK